MPPQDGGAYVDRRVSPVYPDHGVWYDYGVPDHAYPDYGGPYPDYSYPDYGYPDDLWYPEPDAWWPVDSGIWTDASSCSAQINTPCQSSIDCCGNLQCVNLPSGLRVCSRPCTPDDAQTPLVNEDNCPNLSQFACANTNAYGGESYYCLRSCQPQLYRNTCPGGIACHPKDNQIDFDYQTSSCARPMCTRNEDCPVYAEQLCFNDQDCGPGAFCAPDETTGGALSRCAVAGLCERTSGLCAPPSLPFRPTARIGDTCTSDFECKQGMRCQFEIADPNGGTYARNGYCVIDGCAFADTMSHLACPAGSACQHIYPGGTCFRSCEPTGATSCRGVNADRYGDYECYNWNYLVLNAAMQPVAETATCEPAIYTCDFLYPFLECSGIGEQDNPEDMRCRDPATGQPLPEGSTNGVCLDNTASGTLTP